jgi:hypothetical protein
MGTFLIIFPYCIKYPNLADALRIGFSVMGFHVRIALSTQFLNQDLQDL